MKSFAIAFLLSVLAPIAVAENWVTLPEPGRQGLTEIVVDLDSVRVNAESDRLVEITERAGSSEVDLLLDCEEVSYVIRAHRTRYGYDGKILNLSRGSENHYPNWRHAVVLRHICPRYIKNWDELYFSIPDAKFCQTKDRYFQQLCSGNRVLLGEFNLFEKRLLQLDSSCSISRESKVEIQLFFMRNASKCRDDWCIEKLSHGMFSSMEKSLTASQAGKPCTFVDEQLAEIESASKNDKALSDYVRCSKTNIPLLDDKVSSAEVIADALQSRCKSILDAVFTPGLINEFQKNVRQQLVGLVLEHRTAKPRNRGNQQGKSNPQSKPASPKSVEK